MLHHQLIALPSVAWAAGGGGEGASSNLGLIVALILSVVAAYLLAHFLVNRLQQRFLFITGFEYALVGFLLGPAVPQIPAFEDLTPLSPVLALAAGWIGLLYGTALDLRDETLTADVVRIGLVEAIGSGAAVALASWWMLTQGLVLILPLQDLLGATWPALAFDAQPLSNSQAGLCAAVLGCVAAARSSSALDLLQARYGLDGGMAGVLRGATQVADIAAIIAFGLIFCVVHVGETQLGRTVVWGEWVLLTQALGLVLGLMFGQFLGRDESHSDNNAFLALVGIMAFASGAAFYLNLSSMLVNMIVGVVLVHASQHGRAVVPALRRTVHPLRLLMLVFAGALITNVPLVPTVALTLGLLAARTAAKIGAGWLATLGTTARRDFARGTLAQGDVALAMALSFRIAYDGPGVDITYAAIVLSVIVNEFFAPRLLKGLLVDAGEIRSDTALRPAVGQ